MTTLWAAKWDNTCELDGHREYIYIGLGTPKIFRTRQECRDFIEYEWGYIRNRPDLRREPHCWRVPTAVKVRVSEVTSHNTQKEQP